MNQSNIEMIKRRGRAPLSIIKINKEIIKQTKDFKFELINVQMTSHYPSNFPMEINKINK